VYARGIADRGRVFDGNTADPTTLEAQIGKLKTRFGIDPAVLVGDRSMIMAARIRDDLGPAGMDWITCLRAPQIQALANATGRCNSRCPTSGISPKSARPTFPASG